MIKYAAQPGTAARPATELGASPPPAGRTVPLIADVTGDGQWH